MGNLHSVTSFQMIPVAKAEEVRSRKKSRQSMHELTIGCIHQDPAPPEPPKSAKLKVCFGHRRHALIHRTAAIYINFMFAEPERGGARGVEGGDGV